MIKHHERLESWWHIGFAVLLTMLAIAAWIGSYYHEHHEQTHEG